MERKNVRKTETAENQKDQAKSVFQPPEPVVLRNDDGVPVVVVTTPTLTQSGSGYRCRIKLPTSNYINAIFDVEGFDENTIGKGAEIIIYELEFVSIARQREGSRFSEDFVYFMLRPDYYEVAKPGKPEQQKNNRVAGARKTNDNNDDI